MFPLSRQGAAELLLLSALFLHQGYPDDLLYCAGEEDGVCGGNHLVLSLEGIVNGYY